MNLDSASRVLLDLTVAGNSAMLISKSGMGKSSIVKQNLERLRALDSGVKWGSATMFLATQRPTSLIGIQWKGERAIPDGKGGTRTVTVTDPAVPLWMIDQDTGLPAWCFDKFYLFLDEYGQGDPDTKRASAEILLNLGTAPWYLPPGSVVVAASNEGSRYGVTKDFDFIVSRRTRIKVDGDINVTLAHWDKPYVHRGATWQVAPFTKAWAAANPAVVFEDEPKEQGPWANPRTVCDADRYLQVVAAQNGGNVPIGRDAGATEVMEVLTGTIGAPAATSFVQFLTFRTELPSYEDIVADPKGTPAPSRADLMMLMAYELAARALPQDLVSVLTYINKLPKDMAVTFVTALLRRDYKSMIDTPAMTGWINKNAQLISVISAIASK